MIVEAGVVVEVVGTVGGMVAAGIRSVGTVADDRLEEEKEQKYAPQEAATGAMDPQLLLAWAQNPATVSDLQ